MLNHLPRRAVAPRLVTEPVDCSGPRRSSAGWLRVFVLCVCLAIVGLEGWRDWSEYDKALEDAEVQMANLARSLKQHADDTFEMADYALVGLVDMIEGSGTSPAALERLHAVMVNRVSLLPRLEEIAVYGQGGRWLASSSQELLPDRTGRADQAYFLHHADTLSRRPYFAVPDRSRPLGQRTTTISRRFNNPDGSFGGVVVASIDAEYFARFYSQFAVGRQGSIVLLARDGTLLSRYPFQRDFAGSSPEKVMPVVEHLSHAPSGSYRFTAPSTGTEQVSGYDSGHSFPFVVVAAMSRAEALADWWEEVLVRGSAISVLVGAIAYLGWGLADQLRRRETAETQLALLARTDGLTGLANRRSLDERLACEWHRSVRERTPLSLLMIDIDHFKAFNDAHGHQAGDDCLRAVARAVEGVARRPADLAARYGGEEMALLLPSTDAQGAAYVAERVRGAVEALALPHPGNRPDAIVTVSVGTATLNPIPEVRGGCSESLVSLADRALYDAKHLGRNKVVAALQARAA